MDPIKNLTDGVEYLDACIRDLNDSAAEREFTEDEQRSFDEGLAERARLVALIDRHNEVARLSAVPAAVEVGDGATSGGLLVIHEYLAEKPLDALDAAFRLTLLVETGTQTYRYDDYCNWLTAAGLETIERIDLDPREKGSLILARR